MREPLINHSRFIDRATGGHRRHYPIYLAVLFISVTLLASTNTRAQEVGRPDLSGTWMGKLITFDDPRWDLETVLCGNRNCTQETLDHLSEVLADPANDDQPLDEIGKRAEQFNRDYIAGLLTAEAQVRSAQFDQSMDPVNACDPVGLLVQSGRQPLPFTIEQSDDQVVFRYEYWDAVRTIYTDGRNHPEDLVPSLYGHSIGWYDGPTLVVETRGLQPNLYARRNIGGLSNTEHAVIIERYTRSADGDRLDDVFTVVDPRMLRQPLVFTASFLSSPGLGFQEFKCEVTSGEF